MNFDPSQNATIQAALQMRADTTFPNTGAVFSLATQTPTNRTKGDSKYQRSIYVNADRPRAAIAWSAVYRGKVLVGSLIVCNTEQQALATAMILAEASEAFDLIDQKMLTEGSPWALYPTAAPGFR